MKTMKQKREKGERRIPRKGEPFEIVDHLNLEWLSSKLELISFVTDFVGPNFILMYRLPACGYMALHTGKLIKPNQSKKFFQFRKNCCITNYHLVRSNI
jgi:hypothetical protein